MKRHPSLVPLSREHHGSLILARLIQKGAPAYKGLPSDLEGKRKYAIDLYLADIRQHFKKEEKLLNTIRHYPSLAPIIPEIINEHRSLRQMFEGLMKTGSQEELHQLGTSLELHIRKEERQLFPLLEKTCTTNELDGFKAIMLL